MSRLSLLALLSLVGCATDPTTSAATGEVRTPEPTRATLAQVRLSATHTVEFTEASDGDLEVIEHLNADHDQGVPSLAALDPGGRTLADLHRYLVPGARVPDALVAADSRAAARAPAPLDPPPEADAFTVADSEAGAISPSIQWDWVNDENWFRTYYYTGGDSGFFSANHQHISVTKYRITEWFKSSAFNQSFEGNAWFRVKRTYSCFPGTCSSTSHNGPVANRDIVTYLGTGARYRQAWMDGSGVNPRVALATRWVLDGQGTDAPTPSQCGGHLQLACWTGAACDPGLVPYNGACYGCGVAGQGCCKDLGPIPTNGGWQGWCAQGHCNYPSGYCQLF